MMWDLSKKKPAVNHNTPYLAAESVAMFSKELTIRKYTDGYRDETNTANYGDFYESLTITGMVYVHSKETEKPAMDGEHQEGKLVLYILFNDNELPIQLSSEDANTTYRGYGDVLEYDNALWLAKKVEKHDVSHNGKRYMAIFDFVKFEEKPYSKPDGFEIDFTGRHYYG